MLELLFKYLLNESMPDSDFLSIIDEFDGLPSDKQVGQKIVELISRFEPAEVF